MSAGTIVFTVIATLAGAAILSAVIYCVLWWNT